MKTTLRPYCKAGLLILLFGAGVLLAAGVFPIVDLFLAPHSAKRHKDRIKQCWLTGFGSILNLRVAKTGDPGCGPLFLVSNHVSWVDIVVLGQCLPGCFVAKSDIAGWPIIGFLSGKADAIFIRRGDKKQILQTSERMSWQFQQQGNIIAFPEGTTTTGDSVLEFHASLFQPAILTRTTIQPALIQYAGTAAERVPFVGDDDFIPHLWKVLKLAEIEVSLIFLPVIVTSNKHRNEIAADARSLIADAITLDKRSLVA